MVDGSARATFLGWEKPFPESVAVWLTAHWPTMDFGGIWVVVSGGRAGRRILSCLADRALADGLAMVPPKIITAGEMPELLYQPPLPIAGTFARQVAWVNALRRTSREVLKPLFPRLADADGPETWRGAASMLDRCKEELAAGGCDFAAALERCVDSPLLGEPLRWKAAARVHQAYLDQLTAMGTCDRQEARARALAMSELRAPGKIVLAGIVQLGRQATQMLRQVADRVTALVYTPRELADGFDDFGSVNAEFWCRRHVDLTGANLRVARTISDQAEAVFAALAKIGPNVPADQVTIGVADESIVPHLETTAANLDQAEIRYGGGLPLTKTRPCRLLGLVADYLESRDFREFAALVRHPDFERALVRSDVGCTSAHDSSELAGRVLKHTLREDAARLPFTPSPGTPGEDCGEGLYAEMEEENPHPALSRSSGRGESPGVPTEEIVRSPQARVLKHTLRDTQRVASHDPGHPVRDWRSLLDDHAAAYLPGRLDVVCREAAGWRGAAPESGQRDDRNDLAWLFCRVEDFLGGLNGSAQVRAEATAPEDEWAEPILGLLRQAYGRSWDQRDEGSRRIAAACLALRDALGEVHGAFPKGFRAPRVTPQEAIRNVLSLASRQRVPPAPQDGRQLEVVGWLELMADDAPHLIVTGFNEGLVPESAPPNPLINETVREALGLAGDRDRLARDACILTAMVQSRPPHSVTLISGRLSATSDPLLPSRLAFACDRPLLAQRVLAAVDPPPPVAPLKLRFGPGEKSGFRVGAAVAGGWPPITSMRVTAFRDYLASPQGFYLRHVVGLETLQDAVPRELDPRQCGDVVHLVVEDFAATPAASSGSKQQCVDTLLGLLDRHLAAKLGGAPRGALKFQADMIRKRLEILAGEQADWSRQGWRIVQTEWAPQTQASLMVDGIPMGLRGRIDRIDFNERLASWAVLDYKVGSGDKDPEKAHRRHDGAWRDLQLPIYRHLARELIGDVPDGKLSFGYFAVGDRADNIKIKLADWDSDALAGADESAANVVRGVRQGKFDDIGDDPPTDGIFAHVFGEGMLIADDEEEETLE